MVPGSGSPFDPGSGLWLADTADTLDEVARVARCVREAVSGLAQKGLDWGICHGDVSFDNFHSTPGGSSTMYDFDQAGIGSRAYDMCRVYGLVTHGSPGIWEAFLQVYTTAI